MGGGGEEREPPGRDKGAESEAETQRPEEAGKIGEVGQGHGEGPAESVGPTLAQPRRASSAWEPVCAAPWREEAGRRRCGPEEEGTRAYREGDTHNRGRDRDTRRNKRR